MSAPHVSYPPAGQPGLAHMVVADFLEMVEVCKRDRFGIHMKLFPPHSVASVKVTRAFQIPGVEDRLHFLMGVTDLPFLQSAADS